MRIYAILFTLAFAFSANAQAMFFSSAQVSKTDGIADEGIEEAKVYESLADSLIAEVQVVDTLVSMAPLPKILFMPQVFKEYMYPDTTPALAPDYSGLPYMRWTEDYASARRRANALQRNLMIQTPWLVPYNINSLPEAPKEFIAVVNPDDHTITVTELTVNQISDMNIAVNNIKKRHWIKSFTASLQFSEAYLSPNWYQGGNSNLNALLNIYYNVKLNTEYHKNLLFETTFQYKLGMNSAPDDSLRNYNVSEDILQINTVFGVKAAKKWYYSITGLFKTQVVNSYQSNTNNLRSALLSPAELNIGLGMTYNTANAKKTFTFDASIAPLSYNMNICTNEEIDSSPWGIADGKKVAQKFGSSGELKLFWQMTDNISFRSRLFGFTDYSRAYADWENTLTFELNKFLTTQIYAHLRYDTHTPSNPDNKWKKLQVKEILSIGFAYKFSTL